MSIRELKWTDKQRDLIDLIEDKNTRLVFLSGPAGSSKSIVSVYCALKALSSKKVGTVMYSRPILESADAGSKLGYLPGDLAAKTAPYLRVITEKMEELLTKPQIEKINKEKRLEFVEVNYIRGANITNSFVILDECQGFTKKEIVTLLTRISKYCKVIVCADPAQSDLPPNKQGGFTELANLFSDAESAYHGIHHFAFTNDDIMRSELCKFIVTKLDSVQPPAPKTHVELKNHTESEMWSPNGVN